MSALPLEIRQTAGNLVVREAPLRQLAAFYSPQCPSPAVLVAWGVEDVTKSVLGVLQQPYAVVRCADCLTQRHLLSKVFAVCAVALNKADSVEQYRTVDSINSLVVNLQKLLETIQRPLVLIFDGIDKLRGAGQTLLPALARLGDSIPRLSLILIASSPRTLPLHRPGVPYVSFPPYTRAEAIALVASERRDLLPKTLPTWMRKVDHSVLEKLHLQFAAYTYDTLLAPTSSTSVSVYRSTLDKLWPRFIWPFLSNEKPLGRARAWDFTNLVVLNRPLFQAEGEAALLDRLLPDSGSVTFEHLIQTREEQDATSTPKSSVQKDIKTTPLATSTTTARITSDLQFLKFLPILVLIASYLASHTNPKLDILLFSRLSSQSSKSHRVRKSYHQRTTRAGIFSAGSSTAALKVSRKVFDAKAGIARPFTLERLIAILRAIHPHGLRNDKAVSDKVYRTLAELGRLKLVVCVERDRDGDGAGEEQWRVNVGREWIEDVGNGYQSEGIGVRIGEYELQAS